MPVMMKEPLLLSDDDILVAVYVLLPLNDAAKLAGLAQLSFQFHARVSEYVVEAPATLDLVMAESYARPQV